MLVCSLRILSRPVVMKLLTFMADDRPMPPWPRSTSVQLFCFDQTHARDGHTERRRYTAERVDARGTFAGIQETTFITSYRVYVPASLLNLTNTDVNHLREHGPYESDWSNMIPWLQPRRVKAELWALTDETLSLVRTGVRRFGCASPAHLKPVQVARLLFGRPGVDPGGKTPIEILPVILNCDTKSHLDLLRIWGHINEHCEKGAQGEEPVVKASRMDGQSLIRSKDQRNRRGSSQYHASMW